MGWGLENDTYDEIKKYDWHMKTKLLELIYSYNTVYLLNLHQIP